MDEFPKMLYRVGGHEEIHGGRFRTLVVNDEAGQDAALADGWYLTTGSAKEAAELPKPPAEPTPKAPEGNQSDSDPAPSDNVPPTRAELEQKAAELDIKFDGRTSDKKLGELIDAKLKG